MALQALIILVISASVSSQYSSSFIYGNTPRASISGSPLHAFSANSYSSLSSPSVGPHASGTYAPSAPLLAQYPTHQNNPLYDASLQNLVYPSHGYDVTEAPQEPESPPAPIPPPSAPVAFPLPNIALPNIPQPTPQPQPQQPLLPAILSAPGASHSSTSFSSPYVSYQH